MLKHSGWVLRSEGARSNMKKLIRVLLVGCCAYTHRRVIAACVKGEEMPPAPKWHVWCKNRRA